MYIPAEQESAIGIDIYKWAGVKRLIFFISDWKKTLRGSILLSSLMFHAKYIQTRSTYSVFMSLTFDTSVCSPRVSIPIGEYVMGFRDNWFIEF